MHTSLHRDGHTWADKGVPSDATRHPRANGARPVGAFHRGNRGSWGETAIGLVPRPTVALDARLPVVAASHPYADLPDAPDDGCVIISGRFKVKSVKADPTPDEPTACKGCWITPCECGKW
jgi:hypothetical protein